jgi:hypothetical protein
MLAHAGPAAQDRISHIPSPTLAPPKGPKGCAKRPTAYLYPLRHQVLMAEAADRHSASPDLVSFTRSLHVARRSTRSGTSARDLTASLRAVVSEVDHELLPERRLRTATGSQTEDDRLKGKTP